MERLLAADADFFEPEDGAVGDYRHSRIGLRRQAAAQLGGEHARGHARWQSVAEVEERGPEAPGYHLDMIAAFLVLGLHIAPGVASVPEVVATAGGQLADAVLVVQCRRLVEQADVETVAVLTQLSTKSALEVDPLPVAVQRGLHHIQPRLYLLPDALWQQVLDTVELLVLPVMYLPIVAGLDAGSDRKHDVGLRTSPPHSVGLFVRQSHRVVTNYRPVDVVHLRCSMYIRLEERLCSRGRTRPVVVKYVTSANGETIADW